MRAIATKQPTNDSAKQRKSGDKGRSRSISPLSMGMPLLQSKCACGGGCPRCQDELGIQTKLKISEPGDRYEQDADRIADEVMRMPESQVQQKDEEALVHTQPLSAYSIQRQIDSQAEEEEDTELIGDETGRPKRELGAPSNNTQSPSIRIPKASGQPLDKNVRQFMESRIGKDFRHVRVHTDIGAVETSRQLRARAFTVGQNIYFNEGQYRPDRFEGRKLLAHELAHVMQQQEVLSAKIQRECTPGTATCVGSTNQPVHSPHAGNETCSETDNPNPRIQRIEVYRNDFRLRVFFRDGTTTHNPWNCSPSLSSGRGGKVPTPLGHDRVGKKCDNCHTNRRGDGMGFFTGFASHDIAIGFHNSQDVGSGIESHGCVRVSCSDARTINRDTSSSTVIEVLQNEPPDSAPSISGGMRVYTIRAGDTLGGIARRFDTTVARLRELNNIAEGAESSIQPRQTLVIPGSSSSSSSSGTQSYTVQSGDTLSEIAERFGTTVARLRELNHIAEGAESSIQPEQTLLVPEPPR